MNKKEQRKIQHENVCMSDNDMKAYFSSSLECDINDIEIKIEEKQMAVHKQIDMSFFFQGVTIDSKLEKLKEKLADTIREYFREENSSFVSVIELKDRV